MLRGGDGPILKDKSFCNSEQGTMAEETKKKTSPGEFVRQVRAEYSKVVWPTREETVRTAIFVFILMLILSLFFLGVDSLFGVVVRQLLQLV